MEQNINLTSDKMPVGLQIIDISVYHAKKLFVIMIIATMCNCFIWEAQLPSSLNPCGPAPCAVYPP